jgi:hypothetical protein
LSNIFGNPEKNISSTKRQELFSTPNFASAKRESTRQFDHASQRAIRQGNSNSRHYAHHTDDEYYEKSDNEDMNQQSLL